RVIRAIRGSFFSLPRRYPSINPQSLQKSPPGSSAPSSGASWAARRSPGRRNPPVARCVQDRFLPPRGTGCRYRAPFVRSKSRLALAQERGDGRTPEDFALEVALPRTGLPARGKTHQFL